MCHAQAPNICSHTSIPPRATPLPWLSKIIPEKRTHMRDLWKSKYCGSAYAWPSAFSRDFRSLRVIFSPRCTPDFAGAWTAQPNPAWLPGGGLIGRELPLSHAFHPFRPCRTLRVRRKRRPPPARERLAQHSGDGSRRIVGMVWEGGDEVFCKVLVLLRGEMETSPVSPFAALTRHKSCGRRNRSAASASGAGRRCRSAGC